MLGQTRSFLRDLWALTRPYWFSEERWIACGLLAAVIGLSLGQVYIAVLINDFRNAFYNALQDKNYQAFLHQLLVFVELVTPAIVMSVYQSYLTMMLKVRWRRWLTDRFIGEWLANQTYYRLQLLGGGADNPDQRIAEDLRLFVEQTLDFTLGFISNLVTLISFIGILWALSGAVSFALAGMSIAIPGYMVWAAVAYTAVGTWITHRIGWPLGRLNFDKQRYEADFRFSLVRLRENAEGVALYGGEAEESDVLRQRFGAVFRNFWDIMKRTKSLNWFVSAFAQAADIFPIVVAAPRYFSGAIQLGGLMQTANAFYQVQGSMSWFINSYLDLAAWRATVDRLTGFQAVLAGAAAAKTGIDRVPVPRPAITLDEVEIRLPDDRPLINQASLQLTPGRSVLISGPSGSGKSTLFRVLGGLWPYGNGRVTIPFGAKLLFLPQRPYLPLGTLRDVLTYPQAPEGLADEAIRRALADCDLAHLADRLEEAQHWAQRLSPGEQQRIAFARALLQRPDWLFLDEATAALDEAMEARLYGLLAERLPATTIVSIGHRAGLARFHQHHIVIAGGAEGGRLTTLSAAAQVSA